MDREKAIALVRQLNRDLNWIRDSKVSRRNEELIIERIEGVVYHYKFFKYDWDEQGYVAVLEPEGNEKSEHPQMQWETIRLLPEQLHTHAKNFRIFCIMMGVDEYMHSYVLPFLYDQDPALKMHIETLAQESNAMLEQLADYGPFCDEETVLDVPSGGLHYQPLEVIPGVKRVHQHSEAAATLVCQQVPSADEYDMEVTQEWLENFHSALKTTCDTLGIKGENNE